MTTEQMDGLDDNRRKCCNSFKNAEHELTCDNYVARYHNAEDRARLDSKSAKPNRKKPKAQKLTKAQKLMQRDMLGRPTYVVRDETAMCQAGFYSVVNDIISGSSLRLTVDEWKLVDDMLTQAVSTGYQLGCQDSAPDRG